MQKVSNKGDTVNHSHNQNTLDFLDENSKRSSSSNDVSSITEYYLSMVVSRAHVIDRMFGVYVNAMEELQMGESKVEFINDKMVDKTRGVRHRLTPGLVELIFKKEPDMNLVTNGDKTQYVEILLMTNPHRKGNSPTGKLKKTNEAVKKYADLIEPLLFQFNKILKTPHQGKGLPKQKIAKSSNTTIDLVYWDDPNELVDRLRLLMAEKQAGNEAHTNEIFSIISELREAGYIL